MNEFVLHAWQEIRRLSKQCPDNVKLTTAKYEGQSWGLVSVGTVSYERDGFILWLSVRVSPSLKQWYLGRYGEFEKRITQQQGYPTLEAALADLVITGALPDE